MEATWVGVAFVAGLAALRTGLPPLVGYLACGVGLAALGVPLVETLQPFAELGVLLLLFTIGLKLDLQRIRRPEVWGLSTLHMALVIAVATPVLMWLPTFLPLPPLSSAAAATLALALAFSSTVFATKVIDERNDLATVYGRTAIGILVVQDLVAVGFVAITSEQIPGFGVVALVVGLVLLRPLLRRGLAMAGHGDVLLLGGLAATLIGGSLFEAVAVKADLGALCMGVLLGGTSTSKELAKSLAGLRDLLLVPFFLGVGLQALPTVSIVLAAGALLPLMALKAGLFLVLGLGFRLRARTATLMGAVLGQFSEFGLIVGTVAMASGWLDEVWLAALSLAVAASFLISSVLNANAHALYRRARPHLRNLETQERIDEERRFETGDARVFVFGLGHVGTGAYDTLAGPLGRPTLGFDVDPKIVEEHAAAGRRVVQGSATDADFWDRIAPEPGSPRLILLSMSSASENTTAVRQIREEHVAAYVCAVARHEDERQQLLAAGADAVFDVMEEAGVGFAEHALDALQGRPVDEQERGARQHGRWYPSSAERLVGS